MKKLKLVFSIILLSAFVYSQEIKPIYELLEKSETEVKINKQSNSYIIGSEEGLFEVSSNGYVVPIWTEARVEQIVKIDDEKGFLLRTKKGIFYTKDFSVIEERNQGLPFLTIKQYDGAETKLVPECPALKDLAVNPFNSEEIVTATKDAVYYSNNCGKTWVSIGSMSQNTSGIKSVAVITLDGETVVFMGQPMFGFSYKYPNRSKAHWNDISAGFETMKTISLTDEISDILTVIRKNENGILEPEIYLSQTYMPRIYKFNWNTKRAEKIYSGTEPVETIDGLSLIDNTILYTRLEGFGSLNLETKESYGVPKKAENWEFAFSCVPGTVNTAYIPKKLSGFEEDVVLNELWELYPGSINTPFAEKAMDKKSIYASAYQCRNQTGIEKYKKLLKDKKMNSIVIDMKDDNGYLRYTSIDPIVKQKGKTSSYKLDLDHFVQEFKKKDVYLIARIVTFKDPVLASYSNSKYAVWDSTTNSKWQGIRSDDGEIKYYDEIWVDPYCEEVWEYNVAIAKELISRGFDEIQFDYIRFPTDGKNLSSAQYRWKDKGMDKESALISFLSYARNNIDAPLGIDIYGANGWYRCGARTGQDVEMLSEYVDVIGPMFYPSHFEQSFLNYKPFEDRTYRIYYYGSYRNTVMARNRAIIRPWIQCFYLNCSYDNTYYNSTYIKKEFFGVRDSVNRGYMCWNNSGDYSVTPEDVKEDENYPSQTVESLYEKKPAIGTKKRNYYDKKASDVAILDYLKDTDTKEEWLGKSYSPFLLTPLVNVNAN